MFSSSALPQSHRYRTVSTDHHRSADHATRIHSNRYCSHRLPEIIPESDTIDKTAIIVDIEDENDVSYTKEFIMNEMMPYFADNNLDAIWDQLGNIHIIMLSPFSIWKVIAPHTGITVRLICFLRRLCPFCLEEQDRFRIMSGYR